ncbi:lytic transglycosylase domain-containing protein [Pelagibacteraceae bacterium]|jgi:soluble lytic murein transglycosylase|nr:lytic transglycosylase domain-containing protein [Pelagibacteraceae bacterium]MDC1158502.1 lytic transglycosylase domain-containing protein [Pelagibacteraceae bacterium]
MTNKLISLAFLAFFLTTGYSYSEDQFLFPKKKPSVFKKIERNVGSENWQNLPQKKPIIKTDEQNEKTVKLKPNEEKKIEKKEKIVQKKEVKNEQQINVFLLPQKKPITYKVQSKTIEKSTILNQKDFERAKETIKFIKGGKWNSAIKSARKVKDSDFRTLITWMHLKTTLNSATFNDYKNFIEQHENYPRINRIKYLAETKIYLRNNSPTSIINWFDRHPPLGGLGKIKLAEAYLEQKKIDKVESLIKEGWITADIPKNDLGYYRAKFKKFLTTDDHIKRADYLSWERKYWDLKRMLKYLPSDERALYNARQILMSNSYGVDNAISKVPNHLKSNTGLEYDRLRWRNRRGRLDGSLEILYKNSNRTEAQMVRPDKWWEQRKSVSRALIYKKRYKTAYKIASEHALSAGSEFAEAEWLSGWIALTFLKSPEYAISHFQNFYNNVGYPISLARGAYWLGIAYKTLGDENLSYKYFSEGAKFPMTYYGQLSFNEIKPGENFELIDDSNFSKDYEKIFRENKLIKHVILLTELDASQLSKDIIKYLATLNVEKGSEVLAAKLATEVERYDFAIQISKLASYEKRFYNKFNYPIINTPKTVNNKKMPNQEVVLAIIRQESEFDRRANSWAGARGMMQLMKYTAKIVAKQAKLPYSISRLTKDPEYNIKLGSYYFNSLMEDYNGIFPFAIAAYNAGPNRVKTWRRVNGDPSKGQLSYVNWIELIRFKETRNYVQRVLENINVYKYMLSKEPVKIDSFFN